MSKLHKIVLIGLSALLIASVVLNITQCSRIKKLNKQENAEQIFNATDGKSQRIVTDRSIQAAPEIEDQSEKSIEGQGN